MSSPLSPTRLRRRSFLNDPPGYSPNLPGHSILLNCPARSPSPATTSSSHDHGHTEADAIAAKAASGTVSFAPLPVIPPELKRRSSITLGVAARKNLLSSPEDEIYPNPKKNKPPEKAANGSVRAVYMSDEDWEEYKRQHEQKNGGNEVVDIGEMVTAGAKNLWRRVKPPQKEGGAAMGGAPGTSPSPSTSTSSLFSNMTSPKMGSSPGSSNSFLGSFSAPKLSIRRRSDPGTSASASNINPATKSPDLPNVMEEESLSRRESAEPTVPPPSAAAAGGPSSPTMTKYMDWEQKPRSASIDSSTSPPAAAVPETVSPPSIKSPHGPPSPPPRVQDVLPSEDEVHERAAESSGNEEDDYHDAEDRGDVGTLGLERVEIQSEAGHGDTDRQVDYRTGRDSAVLGFDRTRFHGD